LDEYKPLFNIIPITDICTAGRAAKTESLDTLFKKQAAPRTRAELKAPTAKTQREREYKGLQRAHHLLKERMRVRPNENWKALQKPGKVILLSVLYEYLFNYALTSKRCFQRPYLDWLSCQLASISQNTR